MALHPVVHPWEHAVAIGGGEKRGTLGIQIAALSGSGNESMGPIRFEWRDGACGITASGAEPFFGIVGGDIDDLRQSRGSLGPSWASAVVPWACCTVRRGGRRKEEKVVSSECGVVYLGVMENVSQQNCY